MLELHVKDLFHGYFSSIESDPLAFGISAHKLCSKLEDIASSEASTSIDNLSKFEFGSGDKPDYVTLDKSSMFDGFELTMNRKYNSGNSIASFGIMSKAACGSKDYSVVIASSEIARNDKSSIYDFSVEVVEKLSGKKVVVNEKYAMVERNKNACFVVNLLKDIQNYLSLQEVVVEDGLRNIVREDEKKSGVYFADTRKRLIVDDDFSLVPESEGFKIWHGGRHFYYHDSYEGKNFDGSVAKTFEKGYEQEVASILHEGKDIQKKLDICMMIFGNKQKLEKVFPNQNVTV